MNMLLPELDRIQDESECEVPRWSDTPKEPGSYAVQPSLLRLGHLYSNDELHQIAQPALISFPGCSNELFSTTGEKKKLAVTSVRALIVRLLAAVPPGKLHFTFIDPVGLGQNVADFMALGDYNEALVTGKAWTEPQHIEQRLTDVTDHMETVIQKYLRNEFATIEEFNEKAGEIAEPYRVLVVFDFPVNFSEDAARRLVSIMQNGPRCGVYTIVLHDRDQALPHGFQIEDLKRSSMVISSNDEGFYIDDEDYKLFKLELDSPPAPDVVRQIVDTWGKASKDASRVEVPFERIVPEEGLWWKSDSAHGLRVPLGPTGARSFQALELGEGTAQHVLLVGRTGSGKSTLLHTMITSLALQYSPSELELYLIDFKKGVEFKPYANFQLPHARVIAIESEREFGLSVLQGLDTELKQRGDAFRALGVDGLADYRAKADAATPLPRIVLIVDEFQEFFTEDDGIASQATQILDRLVRQGRAFGIHVLLGSQTLAGSYSLARSTIDQMAVRIALMCSEADSRLILADDNPAARLLSRPGEAIYNAMNGRVEGNKLFQVAWLPDAERDRYLEQLRELATDEEHLPAQIIFEGDANARVEQNAKFDEALRSPNGVSRTPLAWLGDPMAIREPVAASFQRQSGSNLLIVGQRDTQALGMLATSVVSLAAHMTAPPPRGQHAFYILDLGAADAEQANPFERLAAEPSLPIKLGRRRQLAAMIDEIAGIVKRRVDKLDGVASVAEIGAYEGPIYLIVYGLQHARDLRHDDSFGFSSFDEEPTANPAQQFTTILDDGPDVGVHTLVWCNTVTNLNRTLDHRALRNFAMKVAFQMSGEDSANLIDTPAATGLGSYRAYFYNEDEGLLEKIRPYDLPSDGWLDSTVSRLASRFAQPADIRIADGD